MDPKPHGEWQPNSIPTGIGYGPDGRYAYMQGASLEFHFTGKDAQTLARAILKYERGLMTAGDLFAICQATLANRI